MFTGGEPLPYTQAARFEELTGVTILQFYGSNETGMLSATTLADPLDRRLRTAGRIVPEMQVRLFDGDRDVTESGRGQPACRGPALSLGYLGGTDHDKLFTKDGWMRMGDICELDADGYLTPGRPDIGLHPARRQEHQRRPGRGGRRDPSRGRGRRGRGDARPGLRRAGLRIRRAQRAIQPSTCPRSSNTSSRRASPRSCCPNDSRCSTNCRGRPAARSQKANFARPFDRHWNGHDHTRY